MPCRGGREKWILDFLHLFFSIHYSGVAIGNLFWTRQHLFLLPNVWSEESCQITCAPSYIIKRLGSISEAERTQYGGLFLHTRLFKKSKSFGKFAKQESVSGPPVSKA